MTCLLDSGAEMTLIPERLAGDLVKGEAMCLNAAGFGF